MGRALCIPFVLVVALADQVVWWEVLDADGALLFYEVRDTETQATCNGGSAVRRNAYLPLDQMRVLR